MSTIRFLFDPVYFVNKLRDTLVNYLSPSPTSPNNPYHECALLGKVGKYNPETKLVECVDVQPPPTQRPKVDSTPTVSIPPIKIYDNTNNTTNNTVTNNTTVIINLPERRLPVSNDDYVGGRGSRPTPPIGGGTRSSMPSKTVTVNNPIKDKEYGALLHEPISNSPVRLTINVNKNFKDNFIENQLQAATDFIDSFSDSPSDTTENNTNDEDNSSETNNVRKITDGSIALVSGTYKFGSIDNLIPVFGSKGVFDFIKYITSESIADLQINTLVPSTIEIVVNEKNENNSNQPNTVLNQLIFNDSNNSIDLTAINRVIGIDDFPISVPETLIASVASVDLVNPPPVTEKTLTSIPQLIHWFIGIFDEVMGQWSVPIEIKDTDPTTPGDQSKLMNFPNVAELLAEMMMMMFQISINSELLTNLNTRILMEAGQDKQQNLITYKLLQSLTDYVGYSYKDEIIEMPLLFDPKATSFDQMLREVQIKVPVPEFDEKFNLQANFMRWNKAASILDTNHFKKINPNADIKTQLMKRLFDLRDLLKEANKEDEGFKEFLEQVEAGFTGTPGVGDPTKPYGDDYENRPRFKDINSEGTIDNI